MVVSVDIESVADEIIDVETSIKLGPGVAVITLDPLDTENDGNNECVEVDSGPEAINETCDGLKVFTEPEVEVMRGYGESKALVKVGVVTDVTAGDKII